MFHVIQNVSQVITHFVHGSKSEVCSMLNALYFNDMFMECLCVKNNAESIFCLNLFEKVDQAPACTEKAEHERVKTVDPELLLDLY